MTRPLDLLVIVGSVREGRVGPTVATWFADQARRDPDFSVTVLDLLEHGPGSDELRTAVAAAEAVVLVTPEYNHAYPATLKEAIDALGPEWAGTPVGFVSYGGMAGGLRAVEALRPVLTELNAVPLRDVVSFHQVWDQFDDAGVLTDPAQALDAAESLLTSLAWWGTVLRHDTHGFAFGARPGAAALTETS